MTGQIFFARTTQTPAKRYSPLFTFERVLSAFMAIFLLLNFGAQEAFADSKPDKKGRMEKARKAFVQARNLCEKGEHRRCIEKYKESLQWIRRAGGETKREALIQFNMAQAYRMLELYPEALSHYREYLKTLPDAPNRDAVETIIEELEAKVKKQPDPVPPAKPEPDSSAEPDSASPLLRPHDTGFQPPALPSTAESTHTPIVTSDLEVKHTPKSQGWLWVGITSGLVAVGAEAAAWALWAKYDGGKTTSNNSYGAAFYAFHGIAGLTAALAVTGFVLYVRSGGEEKPLRETAESRNEHKEDQDGISWNPLLSPSSNGVMLGVRGSWR